MPRYLVRRIKSYIAHVDASTAEEAVEIAQDLSGRDWHLEGDRAASYAELVENKRERGLG